MRGVTQDKEHGGMWKDPTPQANRRYNDPASIPNGSLVPDWYDKPSSTWNSFVFQTLAERTHIAIQAGAWDVLYPETREFRPYSHPELLQDTFPDRFRRFKKEYIAQRPGNTAERDKLVVENQLTAKRGRRDHRMNSVSLFICTTNLSCNHFNTASRGAMQYRCKYCGSTIQRADREYAAGYIGRRV